MLQSKSDMPYLRDPCDSGVFPGEVVYRRQDPLSSVSTLDGDRTTLSD